MARFRNPISDSSVFDRNPIRGPLANRFAAGVPLLPDKQDLVGQWDFANLDTMDAADDGDPIGQLNEVEGSGLDYSQTGGNRPILKFGVSGITSGLSAGEFNGSSNFLDAGDQATMEVSDFTIYIAAKKRTTATDQCWECIQQQVAGAGGLCGILIDTSPSTTFRAGVVVGTNTLDGVNTGVIDTTERILTIKKSGTALDTWFGNTFNAGDTLVSATMDYTTTFSKRSLIGALHRDTGTPTQVNYYDGWIFEKLLYSVAKTPSQDSVIWNYLSSKWCISL